MLADFCRCVDDLVRAQAAIPTYCEALDGLRAHDPCTLLQQVLGRADLIEGCAERSMFHDPGFDRIILLQSREFGWKLRLNVWYPPFVHKLRASTLAHAHAWDHCSLVLHGVMDNAFFVPAAGERGHAYLVRDRASASPEATLLGPARLIAAQRLRLHAGELYYQYGSQVHRVLPECEHLATLCLQTPAADAPTYLFSTTPLSFPARPAVRLAPDALRERIERVIRLVRSPELASALFSP